MLRVRQCLIWVFQSTPPARGATDGRVFQCGDGYISIHAPREGGDFDESCIVDELPEFQSTPPARGATMAEGLESDD